VIEPRAGGARGSPAAQTGGGAAARPTARARAGHAETVQPEAPWALVTGASSGIGQEFARQLGGRGYHIVLTARRQTRLHELSCELREQHGIQTVVVPADLTVPEAADEVWQRATANGRRIGLLINNAGFGERGRFDQQPLARQRAMVQLNSMAMMELAHHAIADMRGHGGGAIVNVASLVAFQPVPGLAVYAATKAFVLSLSEALWAEHREAGIHVMALCPGAVPTEFHADTELQRIGELPGALSTEALVAAALRALERRKSYIVPGAANRASSILGRLLPLPFATRVAQAIIARIGLDR
jgi:uncharacterized protein